MNITKYSSNIFEAKIYINNLYAEHRYFNTIACSYDFIYHALKKMRLLVNKREIKVVRNNAFVLRIILLLLQVVKQDPEEHF